MTSGCDFALKKLLIKNKRVDLQFWDIAGQERFHHMFRAYSKGANGAIVVLDCTSIVNTLEAALKWLQVIEHDFHEVGGIPTIFLVNKVDLSKENQLNDDPCFTKLLNQAIESHSILKWFPTSAKTVTGGGSGIGYGISLGLVKNGVKVYICSRDFDKCQKVAQELTKLGPGSCVAIKADLSKVIDCKKVVHEIKSNGDNHLDILVNNSGCNWGEEIEKYPELGWDKVMNLNVKSIFYLTVECLPLLKEKAGKDDPSRVINIGSIDGVRVPYLETYAYSASKAAVHQLTRTLANKLASDHILVNAIACGPFLSKMTKQTFETHNDVIIQNIPLGRYGDNQDLEGLLVFLSSKASKWITGALIPLDGGVLIKANL
eukprot:gene6016-7496_t